MFIEMNRIDELVKKEYGKLSKQFKIAFISAIIFGLIAHIYMFTNKLPNMDDLVGIDNFGVTFKNGRWFLWVLGAAAYHMNWVFSMPWLNGIITLFFIACSAGVIAVLLDLKSDMANVILGAILVVFPSWTTTFFYMFTAPYYAIAVFLGVLSVFLTVKYKKGYMPAALLLACSLGIYQAYLPFVATMYVILLFAQLYEEDKTYMDVLKKAVYYLSNLIVGAVLYFVLMELSLILAKQSLNTYKGLDSMGKFSITRIQEIGKNIWTNFFGVFINNNLEISYNFMTKVMYFILFMVVAVLLLQLIAQLCGKADYRKAVAVVIMTIAYVLAINGIYIMCAEGIYALMYYAYAFMIIFPLLLVDKSMENYGINRENCILEWIVILVSVGGIGSYCQYANAQYLSMDLNIEQAKSYYTTLITQIKSVDGYTDECKVALIGKGSDDRDIFRYPVRDKTLYRNAVMDRFLSSGRDETMVEAYSRQYFIKYYCGFDAEYADVEELPHDIIEDMPLYPATGSVRLIDGVVVVKMSEE